MHESKLALKQRKIFITMLYETMMTILIFQQ
jgi:hypothetical protein